MRTDSEGSAKEFFFKPVRVFPLPASARGECMQSAEHDGATQYSLSATSDRIDLARAADRQRNARAGVNARGTSSSASSGHAERLGTVTGHRYWRSRHSRLAMRCQAAQKNRPGVGAAHCAGALVPCGAGPLSCGCRAQCEASQPLVVGQQPRQPGVPGRVPRGARLSCTGAAHVPLLPLPLGCGLGVSHAWAVGSARERRGERRACRTAARR